jgi:hypothetical protein
MKGTTHYLPSGKVYTGPTQQMVNAKQKDQTGTRVNWNTGKINKK